MTVLHGTVAAMKIDLDELQRKVENTQGNRCGCAAKLALIARIRELEPLAGKLAEYLDSESCFEERDHVRAILTKGAVLP